MAEGQKDITPIGGHLIANTRQGVPTSFSIQPESCQFEPADVGEGCYEAVNEGADRLQPSVPMDPSIYDGRSPVPYEPQGYVHVFPKGDLHPSVIASLKEAGIRIGPGPPKESGNQLGSDEVLLAEQASAPPMADFLSPDAFNQFLEGFKGEDGKFLAMTAYGAVPLPDSMLRTIPEKLMSQPVVQEREIFVLKQQERTRVTEREYTQFEHKFLEVPKSLNIDKIKVEKDIQVIEVPHFKYKPVVEDKIVEIPLGIKYVEVPIEVICKMPPRIIPVPKEHIVERIIEVTKPVVQEKIIEVPEIVRKKVPKVVTKDIPYIVPKYVEKVIEVPHRPGQLLPAPKGEKMKSYPRPPHLQEEQSAQSTPPGYQFDQFGNAIDMYGNVVNFDQYGQPVSGLGELRDSSGKPFPKDEEGQLLIVDETGRRLAPGDPGHPLRPDIPTTTTTQNAPRADVEDDSLVVKAEGEEQKTPQTFYLGQGIRHVKLPYEAKIDVSIVQEQDIPGGAPIAQRGVRYMAPGSRAVAFNENQDGSSYHGGTNSLDEPLYAGPMDPITTHAKPGMRAVEYRTRCREPEILTQHGVIKYSKFETCLKKDIKKVLPKLPPHELVPMNPPGTPNLNALKYIHLEQTNKINQDLVDKHLETNMKRSCSRP